jgi:hypothetical protein
MIFVSIIFPSFVSTMMGLGVRLFHFHHSRGTAHYTCYSPRHLSILSTICSLLYPRAFLHRKGMARKLNTPSCRRDFLAAVAGGASLKTASISVGICPRTTSRMIRDDAGFASAVYEAQKPVPSEAEINQMVLSYERRKKRAAAMARSRANRLAQQPCVTVELVVQGEPLVLNTSQKGMGDED